MSLTSSATRYEVVREESLGPIRDELVALMNATRTRRVEGGRFDWLYGANPDGPAVIWSLRKFGGGASGGDASGGGASDGGEMVGFTSCLPRRVVVDGVVRRAWIGSDFSVLPRYRTLGLAAKLRRAAKEAIDAGEAELLYAHPNDRMASVHQRVGHKRIGLMQRYARMLRTGPFLEERLQSHRLAQVGEAILDPLLRMADPEKRSRRRSTVERGKAAGFDERFDRLFEDAVGQNSVVGVRDALYLNWRYGTNPLYESQLLTAYREGHLVGYLIFNWEADALMIRDLFPANDAATVRDLLSEATRWGRERRMRSATFTVFEQHPLVPLLMRSGYRPRAEQSQMFAHVPSRLYQRELLERAETWQITVGDRDV